MADRGAASLAQLMASLPGRFRHVQEPRDRATARSSCCASGWRRSCRRASGGADPAAVHDAYLQAKRYFLTQDGKPRLRLRNTKAEFACKEHWEHHKALVTDHAAGLVRAYTGYRRDLNLLVSRGVWRMYQVAEREYRATLDAHALLDFADLLHYTLRLLGQMEEFSQSRYRLESRYQHVLLDEFQDTSRPQWDLVALLIQSWGEGLGLAHHGPLEPSVFIVGDRKQSIYGFRDADVSVLVGRREVSGPAASGHRCAPVDHPQLPLGDAAAGLRQRRLRRHREGARPRRCVRLRQRRPVPASRSRRRRGAGDPGWA